MSYVPIIVPGDISSLPLVDATSELTDAALLNLCTVASQAVEGYCEHRFSPCTLQQSYRAQETDPDSGGDTWALMDWQSQIGLSRAQSLGAAGDLVRCVYLSEYPEQYEDLWTTTVNSVTVYRDFGGSASIDLATLQEIDADTGFVRFALGTYIPVGSRVVVNYSPGYTVSMPQPIWQATLYEAIKMALLDLVPGVRLESKDDFSTDELDDAIKRLLAPYVRQQSGIA